MAGVAATDGEVTVAVEQRSLAAIRDPLPQRVVVIYIEDTRKTLTTVNFLISVPGKISPTRPQKRNETVRLKTISLVTMPLAP